MLSVVSTRYAKALVDVVLHPGSGLDPGVALTQLKSIAEMIAGSQDLRTALLSPAVSPSRKRAVIAALLEPMQVEPRIDLFFTAGDTLLHAASERRKGRRSGLWRRRRGVVRNFFWWRCRL